MIGFDLLRQSGYQDVAVNYAAAQTNTVVVAAPGIEKRIKVLYVEFSVGVTATAEPTFTLKSDGTTQKGAQKYFNQLAGGAFDQVLYLCDVNTALTITTNIVGNHSVYIQYTIV